MGDQDDFVDDNGDGQNDANETPQMAQLRKQLREAQAKAKENEEKASKAAEAERTLAFVQAGVDPNDPKMSYFVKGYDGDLDSTKIAEAAKEAGFISDQPPPSEEDQTLEAEGQALSEIDGMSMGTPLPTGKGENLTKGMIDIFEKGGAPEDIAAYLDKHGYPVSEGFQQGPGGAPRGF